MTVELVTASSPEIVEAMERLIPQLSRSAPALTGPPGARPLLPRRRSTDLGSPEPSPQRAHR